MFLAVKCNLCLLEEPTLHDDAEIVWAKKIQTHYICSFYRPPNTLLDPLLQLKEALLKLFNEKQDFP